MVAPSIKRKRLANLEAERLREGAQKGPVKKRPTRVAKSPGILSTNAPRAEDPEIKKVKKAKKDTSW